MAQYFTSFGADEGYTLGAVAGQGWTNRWATTGNRDIIEDGAASNGRALALTNNNSNSNVLLSYDALDADPDTAEIEVLTRLKIDNTSGVVHQGLAVRAAGGSSGAHGYAGHLNNNNAVQLIRFNNSNSRTDLAESGIGGTIPINTYYFLRVRATGTGATVTLRLKQWTGVVGDEPVDWDVVFDDTSGSRITAAGWAGVFKRANSNYTYDWVGFGTNGDTAPSEPVSAPDGPALTSPSGTPTGIGTAIGNVTTDTANGTAYAVVTASATAPSIADIKAGTGALWSGSQAVSAVGELTFNATGLLGGRKWFHFVHEDSSNDDSNVATAAFHMPELVNHDVINIQSDRLTAYAESRMTTGKVLMIVTDPAVVTDPPTAEEMKQAAIDWGLI